MSSIFSGGMTTLAPFVGCFSLNPLGYPRVAMRLPLGGWRAETLTADKHEAFLDGAHTVLEDALRFRRSRAQETGDEFEIPGTIWRLAIEGPDQFRLWRPRFSLSFDLNPAPWTDLIQLRKEYLPQAESRRFIAHRFRRTQNAAERFRDVKEMMFARAELREEFGHDPRAMGMLEHQLTMQFRANIFQRMKVPGGNAIALNPREPLIDRWRPHSSRSLPAEVDQEAPTPAQGIPITDPDYPYRMFYESDPALDHFRMYLSPREPEYAALSLELGLRTLWERIENFVETTDRTFPTVGRAVVNR